MTITLRFSYSAFPSPVKTRYSTFLLLGVSRFPIGEIFCRGPNDFCRGPAPVGPTLATGLNVGPTTEISVHAEFSHCLQNWYYGLQAMYSSMTLKSRGPCTIGPPLPESEGVRTPEHPQDRRHWLQLQDQEDEDLAGCTLREGPAGVDTVSV